MNKEDREGCLIFIIVIIGVGLLVSLTSNMDFDTLIIIKRIIAILAIGLGVLSWFLYHNIYYNFSEKYNAKISEAQSKNEDVKAGILEYERDKKLNLIRILGKICLILAIICFISMYGILEYD